MKIKKNDNVAILGGKDKGKSGIVERVIPATKRIVVKGLNVAKKHVKPSQKNPQGGIIDINLPLDISNVALICPNCGKPTRIGYNVADGAKTRICRKCNQSVEVSAEK